MPLSTNLHQRFTEQSAWTLEARKLFFQTSGLLPGCRILEAGCGTGAVLSSLKQFINACLFGIDIQPDMVRYAHSVVKESFLSAADANRIPFPDNSFDAVVCHYLLLWVKNPETMLMEFMRVTKPGGYVVMFAEPDYGSRIEYPPVMEEAGRIQREALIQHGANPDIGRRVKEILANTGCINISTGILGAFQSESDEKNGWSEQSILQKDLSGMLKPEELKYYLDADQKARKDHIRIQFIPTFYGWGRKPEI
jgi:ubiquinone/menaquinone biosynthesis C-methylase UbiE